ncbi:hypothetical protein [Conexibacter sp. SYSU D00693]|uniref:hypothetical protein n=1 Tax=Conexibacter sp. SYSU D00693 TaxID=2812560 RepID=UPI00196A9847|nr:hypothetical protein [Conexibacter sp. SYSU D00693]
MADVFIETVPLDATDFQREAQLLVLSEFVSGMQEAGMVPVVDVQATSAGDVFIITVDEPEPR